MKLNIQNTFTSELPADSNPNNFTRQVDNACYSLATPINTKAPKLLHANKGVAKQLGFEEKDLKTQEFLNLVTGNQIYSNTAPYAMCYGGHQFGNWAGQLGDGRAINLFQVQTDASYTLQLKGAGKTPYSRTADGLAVLRSSVREYLCAEAMHHLGVPTTRSLSLSLSGDQVLRDMLYNGNAAYEPGAIVARVSESFIRFGSFQIFASRNDKATLGALMNYTIRHYFPHLTENDKDSYAQLFQEVVNATVKMIVHWQRVGFVHGVMNTDNMSILGQTIDYGPYGWLDNYDPDWTPNTTDSQNRRYRYGQQPNIGLWNLYQLANTFYTLTEDAKPLEEALASYKTQFETQNLEMMCAKIGIQHPNKQDAILIQSLETNLKRVETDMTLFFRLLAAASQIEDCLEAFYIPEELKRETLTEWQVWFEQYQQRLMQENIPKEEIIEKMNAVNPKYVLRNYMSQLAIDAAEEGDYSLIDELYTLLQNPYDEQPELQKWFAKRPNWAKNKVGCSMLSCSS
ncbi:YdiU family protein [Wenyingzhuangia sp. 1_MG-2023]|nr:YdiU family protein [Wenyingzhuangia sp. 1_MG-2023]